MPPIHSPWRLFAAHPRGLLFLCLTQMWERFSFYGMRSLLILYLTQHLLVAGHSDEVIGYPALEALLQRLFGPLSVQGVASQIYGCYEALVYLTPLLGGIIADRYAGQRRSIYIGGILIALGHLLMMYESALLLALTLIVAGSGLFTPNLATQVGALYAGADPRRDSAFSVYYLGINIGAFAAPLLCGTVGEIWGWHYGFGIAGGGMLIGLLIYSVGRRHLPADLMTNQMDSRAPVNTPGVWLVLALLTVLSTLFWASYGQVGNVLSLWLLDDTQRTLGSFELKVSWFQSINPLLILLGTPVIVALWSARSRQASTITRMALGCLFVSIGYLILCVASATAGPGVRVSWLWTLAYLFALTLGELYLSPTSWSLFSKLAPRGSASLAMGVWFLALFAGSYLAGFIGMWWERVPRGGFWLMIATVAAVGAVGLLLLRRVLDRLISNHEPT